MPASISDESAAPCRKHVSTNIRKLEPPSEAEAWMNVSGHGNWNRLHTHQGAAWSGVYYVQVPSFTMDHSRPCNGHLIMKPTPHRCENTYMLNDTEVGRLNLRKDSFFQPDYSSEFCTGSHGTISVHDINHTGDYYRCAETDQCAEYISIPPEEGCVILFPSYLHHAVAPLAVLSPHRATDEASRISLAFNFNEAVC